MAQLTMPNVGEGVTEGTVTRWLKREGDDVALDEPVVEVETDKALVEVPSPYAGKLARILVQEGEVVPIGAALAEFELAEGVSAAAPAGPSVRREAEGAPPAEAAKAAAHVAMQEPRRMGRYSPVVLKLAAEHGIDLSLVRGTGIEGRVTRQDVMRYLDNPTAHTVPPLETAGVVGVPSAAAPQVEGPQELVRASPGDEVVPLTPTRRTIAARMLESHRTIPTAWMAVEADVTQLVALRERVKDAFEQAEGVRLTYLPFFIQAISGALKEHPQLNATFSAEGISLHGRLDLGIAIATDWGLVVPVIRNAGDKSIAGLAAELEALGAKARDRKLALEEMRGATLTIDNTGAFGSIISQPIVPVGQVAIITTEAIRRELRPTADGGFAPRSLMNLCLSFDHRALDGAQAGRFMQAVRSLLEAYRADQQVS